ncbi:hypothetical protein BCR39DRAFT_556491 [Naematelia encephala]|uniref:Uncharacterized protein n=1 Tax=Naematelia encephala TaxID=71784 RepID=A0A1Y2BK55_9TREE|nr:hypothetical protein BCR39DRAFT_556491 [Naematelia encephala]
MTSQTSEASMTLVSQESDSEDKVSRESLTMRYPPVHNTDGSRKSVTDAYVHKVVKKSHETGVVIRYLKDSSTTRNPTLDTNTTNLLISDCVDLAPLPEFMCLDSLTVEFGVTADFPLQSHGHVSDTYPWHLLSLHATAEITTALLAQASMIDLKGLSVEIKSHVHHFKVKNDRTGVHIPTCWTDQVSSKQQTQGDQWSLQLSLQNLECDDIRNITIYKTDDYDELHEAFREVWKTWRWQNQTFAEMTKSFNDRYPGHAILLVRASSEDFAAPFTCDGAIYAPFGWRYKASTSTDEALTEVTSQGSRQQVPWSHDTSVPPETFAIVPTIPTKSGETDHIAFRNFWLETVQPDTDEIASYQDVLKAYQNRTDR